MFGLVRKGILPLVPCVAPRHSISCLCAVEPPPASKQIETPPSNLQLSCLQRIPDARFPDIDIERHGICPLSVRSQRDAKWPLRGEMKMSGTLVHCGEDREIAEQKLWRAVIASTVQEWVQGPLRRQREAEQFLFHDKNDYRTVCFSAGIDPENLRDRLQKIRARTNGETITRALRN